MFHLLETKCRFPQEDQIDPEIGDLQGHSPAELRELKKKVDEALINMEAAHKPLHCEQTNGAPTADGGGVRLQPPRLVAPPILQYTPMPTAVQDALKQDFAERFDEEHAATMPVEDMAKLIIEDFEDGEAALGRKHHAAEARAQEHRQSARLSRFPQCATRRDGGEGRPGTSRPCDGTAQRLPATREAAYRRAKVCRALSKTLIDPPC